MRKTVMQGEALNINIALIVHKNLNFFFLEINIFYFLWHVPVTLVNGNQAVNHCF